ncbi:MAG: DUF2225 domain-containing protein [Peptococcaceae bacterium]|nr:DUF2225 domain-containing protein [Peptococcaceae bacterium]
MAETRSNGLYDREYNCPNCGDTFKTKRVLTSKIVVMRKDPDFCPYYRGVNPLFYEVKICPYCSYAFTDGFGPLKQAQKAKLRQLHKHGAGSVNFWGERDLDMARESFRRALLIARIIEERHLIVAGLSIRMAWMYRYSGDLREERRFLTQSLNQYELAYEKESFEQMGMDRDTLHYLLGELSGKLGRYAEAKRWFGKVIPSHKVKRALHNMAEDQWEIYKAEMEAAGPKARNPRQPDRKAEIEAQAERIIKETEIAKQKIDENVYKEMIQLEALAVERVRLLVESSKAKMRLELDAQNRLANLDQWWRQEI